MSIQPRLKNLVVTLSLIAGLVTGLVVVFYVHALAGLWAEPIAFSEPPAFVEKYVAKRYKQESSAPDEAVTKAKLTTDYFIEAALVRNVMVNGESPTELIRLFTHSDKVKRIKTAAAFADVNMKLSHDEGTDFDNKRKAFWQQVEVHSADIQSALFEALIVTAQERTRTYIPYTLAWWMQEDKAKAVEMLTWAAKHHPDPWVRNFSVYYVIQFGGNEEYAQELIQSQTHDPVFKVRHRILEQRFRRFEEMLFGKEEEQS
ncbi:hypothetical protein [Thalassotalea euphylliae]|uniref:HEAT repeat domain-containing protein n=1 Tax=Thalassotalea euphylliae TaxID=1655234 RepID=A0A3E0U5C8_9GAMM|nr:hypothetical protein [Thalassotalea euphylliae]REL31385.1 hypothetical protein DXX94_12035 [Thalassotalea euphylliae]